MGDGVCVLTTRLTSNAVRLLLIFFSSQKSVSPHYDDNSFARRMFVCICDLKIAQTALWRELIESGAHYNKYIWISLVAPIVYKICGLYR